jgi:hypothetical protein
MLIKDPFRLSLADARFVFHPYPMTLLEELQARILAKSAITQSADQPRAEAHGPEPTFALNSRDSRLAGPNASATERR